MGLSLQPLSLPAALLDRTFLNSVAPTIANILRA